jgi:hypothetical protein
MFTLQSLSCLAEEGLLSEAASRRRALLVLRSLGVGGYVMEVPRAPPVGLHSRLEGWKT